MERLIGSLGFDAGRLGFAFRTALAAALAVLLAWALGLEHPQWAGMSTWAAAQPIRGQLLEKSFFRVAGTVVGAAAGVGLILAFALHPWLLVAGLSLWVGFCTWLGNLQRGFVAYGAVLAGYSAAMVALLETAHPGHVLHLAGDRVATALTGVAVATLLGWAFAGPADAGGLRRRVGGLVADLLDHAADPAPGAMPGLLARLAALDETLDPHAAGRLRGRREVRAMRSLLLTATELLFASEGAGPSPAAPVLRRAAAALREGRGHAAAEALRAVAPLRSLAAALADPGLRAGPGAPPAREAAFPVILHRDRVMARESALRATGALLLAGAFWQATGWEAGAFLMLGLSVMVSLFSTFEDPGAVLPHVWLGQACGVLAALACRWLVWPLAGGEAQLILMMAPFILIGPLLMAHRRTGAMSFDYNMGLLLMLQPHWPLAGSLAGSLQMGSPSSPRRSPPSPPTAGSTPPRGSAGRR